MKRRSYAILSALFVLGLTAGLIVLAEWLSGLKSQPMHHLTILTRGSVTGLAKGAPVLYRGIAAGHVTHIGFDPQNPNLIEISAVIRKNTPLVPGTHAHLEMSLFSTSATISLTPPTPALQGAYHPPHPYPHMLWMTPMPMSTLLTNGAASARHLRVVTKRLATLLSHANELDIQASLHSLHQSLALIVRIERHLDQTAHDLPETQQTLNHLMGSTQTLVQKADRIPFAIRHSLADTRALARTLAIETLPQLDRTLRALRKAASNLSALAHTLARNPQAWLLGHRSTPPGPHPDARPARP
ncbi:MAG: MlaD family protein [Gammaproteobacteria bacterium]